jgi:hypothetical protein
MAKKEIFTLVAQSSQSKDAKASETCFIRETVLTSSFAPLRHRRELLS